MVSHRKSEGDVTRCSKNKKRRRKTLEQLLLGKCTSNRTSLLGCGCELVAAADALAPTYTVHKIMQQKKRIRIDV